MKKTQSKKPKLPSTKIDLNPKSLNSYESIGALILDKIGCDDPINNDVTTKMINEVLADVLLLPATPISSHTSKPVSLDNPKGFRKKRLKPFDKWMKQAVKESGIDCDGVGIVKFLALYCKRWGEMAANDKYHPDRDTSTYVANYLAQLLERIAENNYDQAFSKQVEKQYGKRKMTFTPIKGGGGSLLGWTYGGKENKDAEEAMSRAYQRANMQYTIDLIRAFGLLIQDHRYWWI